LIAEAAQVNAQNNGAPLMSGKDTVIIMDDTELYIAMPNKKGEKYPVLMAIHGSGREARSYRPTDDQRSDFYVHQRNIAVDNGFMFVVVSNGADTWGTNRGLERTLAAYQYVNDHYDVEKRWDYWTTSAGGALFVQLAKQHPKLICRAVGTFPVYDLEDSFNRLKRARNAWGNMDTVKKCNPTNYPEVLIGIPYLIFHGRSDSAVPVKLHSGRLAKEVNKLGGKIRLKKVPGGHSTNNWNVYDDDLIRKFLLKEKY
jgi:pimeloyl-ACP methyl ester carboxylesterase